ncbi:MAG TPA: sulfurtransferase complex subunit TusB [Spongiibacteraceae bacterium]|nr:sulfurtransferase complex subunit TusB [Spongiibacteraceae bacterium]HCS26403.1 sulfurtransferase complex subunit TusB [Spongiibacteraceae bacterium]|tara:strand:+ start:3081 stop:3368 length:288 start_codon:yes stop_codon:yes gene_type:complete
MSDATVHLIQKSPFDGQALESCLRVCAPNDLIVLMYDAVYAATMPRQWPATAVYALADDVSARGISDKLQRGIDTIDYTGLVELCAAHRHSQSWF